MQELIYPSHLLVLPGHMDPALGPLVALARSGMLLYLAILTLLAGAVVVRHGSRAGASEADLAAAPLGNTGSTAAAG